jgi:GT2 family glycosyltransferase
MTRIAVVILNFNGEKLLQQFLPSVILHSPQSEIWVIDNGSTDQSLNVLKNNFPQVKIITLEKNFGFCGGYNRGLRLINAPYYVLLNSDIEVTDNWLQPLENILNQHAEIAAVQPKILSYSQRHKFEYAGAGGGYIDSLGYPFCRGRLFDFTEEDHGQYNDTREVFWASGACLMIRSSVYNRFEGLDEDLFAHMEEIDLCWKISRTNDKIFYCGQSKVYHVGAGTLGYESPAKTYLNFRNALTIIYKHFDPVELWYKMPFRIMLDWLAAFVFLVQGKPQNAGSVFKAHRDFFSSLGLHRSKRRALRKQYPEYPRRNVFKGFVVALYFVFGRRVISVNNPK